MTRNRSHRALTSSDTVVSGIADPATCAALGLTTPCSATARGTTLETPPNQAMGGGLNASLTVTAVTTAPAPIENVARER